MSSLLCIQKNPLKSTHITTSYVVKEVLERNAYVILREATDEGPIARGKYKSTITK